MMFIFMIERLLQLYFLHLHFALHFITEKIKLSLCAKFKYVKKQIFEGIRVKRLQCALKEGSNHELKVIAFVIDFMHFL